MLITLPAKAYHKKHGNDSIAITDVHDYEIYLGPKGKNYETIVHELVHAYLVEICTYSADIEKDAFEEIFCDLMAKRGYEILDLAIRLLKEIEKRKL